MSGWETKLENWGPGGGLWSYLLFTFWSLINPEERFTSCFARLCRDNIDVITPHKNRTQSRIKNPQLIVFTSVQQSWTQPWQVEAPPFFFFRVIVDLTCMLNVQSARRPIATAEMYVFAEPARLHTLPNAALTGGGPALRNLRLSSRLPAGRGGGRELRPLC